ncbi:MAG: shikimate kinase [Lachnospiraceae bacterium]|nr:shikimate kinase [Lachnospiraceae bacterium]
MNIVLIGFMGSGKTTFGQWLADKQAMNLVDTDEFIEALEGRSVKEIFAMEGEGYFRSLETETLKMLLGRSDQDPERKKMLKESSVISVGGGLPMTPENQPMLQELGKIVFLAASKEELVRRLSNDTSRPLLAGHDLAQRIEELIALRNDTYEDLCDIIVETDGKSMNDLWKEIFDEFAKA